MFQFLELLYVLGVRARAESVTKKKIYVITIVHSVEMVIEFA
jgi:hypothetical protein